jgi:hypothetical protein
MRVRYQGEYLRLGQRKRGPNRWEFLWWDFEANGTRVRRKAIIGTVQQYPNLENAWQASNGLRVSIRHVDYFRVRRHSDTISQGLRLPVFVSSIEYARMPSSVLSVCIAEPSLAGRAVHVAG